MFPMTRTSLAMVLFAITVLSVGSLLSPLTVWAPNSLVLCAAIAGLAVSMVASMRPPTGLVPWRIGSILLVFLPVCASCLVTASRPHFPLSLALTFSILGLIAGVLTLGILERLSRSELHDKWVLFGYVLGAAPLLIIIICGLWFSEHAREAEELGGLVPSLGVVAVIILSISGLRADFHTVISAEKSQDAAVKRGPIATTVWLRIGGLTLTVVVSLAAFGEGVASGVGRPYYSDLPALGLPVPGKLALVIVCLLALSVAVGQVVATKGVPFASGGPVFKRLCAYFGAILLLTASVIWLRYIVLACASSTHLGVVQACLATILSLAASAFSYISVIDNSAKLHLQSVTSAVKFVAVLTSITVAVTDWWLIALSPTTSGGLTVSLWGALKALAVAFVVNLIFPLASGFLIATERRGERYTPTPAWGGLLQDGVLFFLLVWAVGWLPVLTLEDLGYRYSVWFGLIPPLLFLLSKVVFVFCLATNRQHALDQSAIHLGTPRQPPKVPPSLERIKQIRVLSEHTARQNVIATLAAVFTIIPIVHIVSERDGLFNLPPDGQLRIAMMKLATWSRRVQ
jgi:hypothetical protein